MSLFGEGKNGNEKKTVPFGSIEILTQWPTPNENIERF